ncbi:DUF6242 domain-containing protein [Bacteroides sp.]|uniref:DUF6242 domain-containing protein n=1 Tax=Bacteroides sp. TaxID=29523 RepID=UPI0025BB0BB0|nr:DUF6242 domain-containing protein [Bacteroides sp.]
MKIRILPALVAGVMATTAFLSSCLKSNYAEIDYPVESSIKAFSIGTLRQTIYGKDSEGNDSIYTDTISYAHVPFTIDQINRQIYNKDSLPKEVDVTRVLASISADNASIWYKNKYDRDSLWTSADSLDFTNEVTFKVLAYSELQNNFVFGKPYTVKVNVHKLNPDSLVWKHFGDKKFAEGVTFTEQKAVYMNDYIYVFGETAEGNVKIYKANVNRGSFTSWEEVSTSITSIDINSAIVYNNEVHFIADEKLYNLNSNNQISSETNLSNLISVNGDKLLAYTTDNKIVSLNSDGTKAKETDFIEGKNLNGRISAVSYTAEHNTSLWRTIVMKNRVKKVESDTTAMVFNNISSEDKWQEYTPINPTTCPNQGNISMISYDGKLFAYGEDFDYFYSSTDNGLNWKKEEGYMIFPAKEENGIKPLKDYLKSESYSTTVEGYYENDSFKGSFIWFIWNDGSLTRCCLNRLMPKE